jgi:F-type H+/Na+-transporting ATPase subunit beta
MAIAGTIVSVNGNVAIVRSDDRQPAQHDVLATQDKDLSALLEVYGSISPNTVTCFVLRGSQQLRRGMPVVNTHEPLQIPVGEEILGRTFDIFGQPHDNAGPVAGKERRPLYKRSDVDLVDITQPTEVIETGIRAIDFFVPILRGGRTGLVGGAGVGKTVVLTQLVRRIAFQQEAKQNAAVVFSAVGERSREAVELLDDLKEAEIMNHACIVLGQMGENPAVRLRTAFAGATIAAYFRDEVGRDVLFYMDNMYRFTQAGHELATVMNTIPSEDGYQATLTSEMANLNERLVSRQGVNITSMFTVFVPADDLTDSGTRAAFSYLDTTIILSRSIFQAGRYPAVDVLRSSSAALQPYIVGEEHYQAYIEAKRVLEASEQLERIVSLIGEEELSEENRLTYRRAKQVENYLTQDLYLSEAETGHPSVYEPIGHTITTILAILRGDYDALPVEEFRYVTEPPVPARAGAQK